ncbi:MAG TPA: signal recognition particle-docking protein FtsY [Stellaceae bacterium]|nr:signal recognition particle-docking protein FtsY [Stellaceae bacterium]
MSEAKGGWFSRLRQGLARSSAKLSGGIADIFAKRRLDDATLGELEELLIGADLGVSLASEATETLRRTRFNQEVTPEEIRASLAEDIVRRLAPAATPLAIDHTSLPFVMLVVGVNGSGKTTTIGKLGKQFREAGWSVLMAAGDTFRAAAVEQLKIWGERAGVPVVAKETGADAAGLAFEAVERARREGIDVVLIDTAGRLQNKSDLMAELQKVVRAIRKADPRAPQSVLLVLDATVGQNAHQQVDIFRSMVGVTGLAMTKLDGTAKGGVLVAVAERFGLPIHFVGVGEAADDLRPFDAQAFARGLVGLDA